MQKISVLMLSLGCLSFSSCWFPFPPKPPEPPEECMKDVPWCNDVNQTCSTDESPCKHNPTTDPTHCELAPDCIEPEPNECPYEVPIVDPRIDVRRYGQGWDATVKTCPGNAWCLEHTGKNNRCCPPAPEGSSYEIDCNKVLLGQYCPSWEYRTSGMPVWNTCTQPAAPMSCDHFDHNNPDTPYNGSKPECLKDYDPVKTGYFVIIHGLGDARAVSKDGSVVSAPFFVNY